MLRASGVDMVRYLFVVSKSRPDLADYLVRHFSDEEDVLVTIDRRRGERRRRLTDTDIAAGGLKMTSRWRPWGPSWSLWTRPNPSPDPRFPSRRAPTRRLTFRYSPGKVFPTLRVLPFFTSTLCCG